MSSFYQTRTNHFKWAGDHVKALLFPYAEEHSFMSVLMDL